MKKWRRRSRALVALPVEQHCRMTGGDNFFETNEQLRSERPTAKAPVNAFGVLSVCANFKAAGSRCPGALGFPSGSRNNMQHPGEEQKEGCMAQMRSGRIRRVAAWQGRQGQAREGGREAGRKCLHGPRT